jgi:uncharacterized membrane protein
MTSATLETIKSHHGKPEKHARGRLAAFSGKALGAAAAAWFVVAVAGQFIFVLYILSFYGGSALQGNLQAWNKVLPTGHVQGDTPGNIAIAIHVLIAAVVTIGGPLQLIPKIRTGFPRFHRWNGRVYIATVVVASVTGLFVVWTRSANNSFPQHLTISINAILILIAVWFALRHAVARKLAAHRRWAVRLFLVVSGSWFFRVILMFWIAVNGGPAGFDPKTFQGPALVAIGLLQYVLPLAMLELYFAAKTSAKPAALIATAGLVFALTGAMAVGIAVATMGMWLPNML